MIRNYATVVKLRKQGLTLEAIGQRYGVSREQIRRRLLREGVTGFTCSFCRKPTRSAKTVCRSCRTWAAQAQRRQRKIDHFWERVDQTGGPDACWPWTGYIHPNGYGWVTWQSRREGTHRVAWALAADDEIPRGKAKDALYVIHSCDNPPCCNPKHLRRGTQADNMHDRDSRGRHVGKLGWRKPICLKCGNPRTPENIYEYEVKTGPQRGKIQRLCRVCLQKQRREKHRRNYKPTGRPPGRPKLRGTL